jgi:hypothetical protein
MNEKNDSEKLAEANAQLARENEERAHATQAKAEADVRAQATAQWNAQQKK